MGFIAALPYIAMALKQGADMYGQHKEGKALEEAQERQEDEQRRLDAIAMFTKRPPGQAGFKYEMPRSARIANVVGSLAALGGQVAMMKAGGGGGRRCWRIFKTWGFRSQSCVIAEGCGSLHQRLWSKLCPSTSYPEMATHLH